MTEFKTARIGLESICATCVYGKIVRTRSVPHPQNVLEWQAEHPELAGSDAPFVILDEIDSYCTNSFFAPPGRGAKRMGIVLSCEEFKSREY